MENSGGNLRDSEIALMDAIKTIAEIIMTAGIAKPAIFDRMFAAQRDGYLAKQMPNAAGVVETLRLFCVDPSREAHRQQLNQILGSPPQGEA